MAIPLLAAAGKLALGAAKGMAKDAAIKAVTGRGRKRDTKKQPNSKRSQGREGLVRKSGSIVRSGSIVSSQLISSPQGKVEEIETKPTRVSGRMSYASITKRLEKIVNQTSTIDELLKEQYDIKTNRSKKFDKTLKRIQQKRKEEGIEGGGVLAGLGKIANKIKPTNFFSWLLNYLTMTLLGGGLIGILNLVKQADKIFNNIFKSLFVVFEGVRLSLSALNQALKFGLRVLSKGFKFTTNKLVLKPLKFLGGTLKKSFTALGKGIFKFTKTFINKILSFGDKSKKAAKVGSALTKAGKLKGTTQATNNIRKSNLGTRAATTSTRTASKGIKGFSGIAKAATKGFKIGGKFIRRIPIIGPLLILAANLLDPDVNPTRAVYKAVGAALGGGIGAVIAGGATAGFGALVGGILGEVLGEYLGDIFYLLVNGGGINAVGDKIKNDFVEALKVGNKAFNWAMKGFGRFYEAIPKFQLPKIADNLPISWLLKGFTGKKLSDIEIPNPVWFLNPMNGAEKVKIIRDSFFGDQSMKKGEVKGKGVSGTGLTEEQFEERGAIQPGDQTTIDGEEKVFTGYGYVTPEEYKQQTGNEPNPPKQTTTTPGISQSTTPGVSQYKTSTTPPQSTPAGGGSTSGYGTPEQRKMLDAIAFAEGTSKSYGTLYGGKVIPELASGQMTISEVLQMQKTKRYKGKSVYGSGYDSNATGRYQFMSYVLEEEISRQGIDPSEKFTPAMQDRIILGRISRMRGVTPELLKKEGMSDKVIDMLAPEFASFPNLFGPDAKGRVGTNTSYYGQGGKTASQIKKAYGDSSGGGGATQQPQQQVNPQQKANNQLFEVNRRVKEIEAAMGNKGTKQKIMVPGVGSFVSGRNAFNYGMDKFFDSEGNFISKEEFMNKVGFMRHQLKEQKGGAPVSTQPQTTGSSGSQAFGTGLKTGPSQYIGGSEHYHIDTKLKSNISMKEQIKYFDQMAKAYEAQGRVIEFSNQGVADQRYTSTMTYEQKADLLRRAAGAHANRKGWNSFDYYIPKSGEDRWGKSAEGAEIFVPTVAGGSVEYGTAGDYGNFVTILDEKGNVIGKTGHGDSRFGKSSGTVKIDGTPSQTPPPAPSLPSQPTITGTQQQPNISSRPSYDPQGSRDVVIPLPSAKPQVVMAGGGGGGGRFSGGGSPDGGVNNYYKQQLIGFLYKQG